LLECAGDRQLFLDMLKCHLRLQTLKNRLVADPHPVGQRSQQVPGQTGYLTQRRPEFMLNE